MSFLSGEARGNIAKRDVSHRKCQGINVRSTGPVHRRSAVPCPAERRRLIRGDCSERLALTRLVAAQGGGNVTVSLL